MTRTARSSVFLLGLLVVVGGLASDRAGIAVACILLGALLIARSGISRPLPLALAVVLLGLAVEVLIVAAPTPVDWPMLGVAGLAVVAAMVTLRFRARSSRLP